MRYFTPQADREIRLDGETGRGKNRLAAGISVRECLRGEQAPTRAAAALQIPFTVPS